MTYDLGQQLVGWLDKFKPASLPPVQPWSRAWRGGLGRRCGDTLKGKHGTKMNQLFYQVPARMYWQFTSGCETRRWARELVIYLSNMLFRNKVLFLTISCCVVIRLDLLKPIVNAQTHVFENGATQNSIAIGFKCQCRSLVVDLEASRAHGSVLVCETVSRTFRLCLLGHSSKSSFLDTARMIVTLRRMRWIHFENCLEYVPKLILVVLANLIVSAELMHSSPS